MARIFICYAREDRKQVESIYDRLQQNGFRPWMASQDLLPGQNWDEVITTVLQGSSLILVCLSENTNRPGYVQREFGLTLDALKTIPEDMIHTIPVRLVPCEVPNQFSSLHWCDVFEPDGFDRLVEAIRHGLKQRADGILPASTESSETTDQC